jgi:hypothetical protein
LLVNLCSQAARYAVNTLQILYRSGEDAIHTAEMHEQCTTPGRTYTCDILQTRPSPHLCPPGSMPGNSEAMGFIAYFLDQVESGIVRRQL